MQKILFFLFFSSFTTFVSAQISAPKPNAPAMLEKKLIGTKKISLQWISWNDFGNAKIFKRNDTLHIKGEQKSKENSDFVRIEGYLEPLSEREFKFTGIILTQVSHINKGKPCKREGSYTFKATQNRKFWRLKDMLNCDGEVTDYVDIYFF
ncbi:MAG: hypothetical protein H7Y04_09480 [Verrucomicrobia bacterium]|nr:hypothetical protein [Cytophagales bacterium]